MLRRRGLLALVPAALAGCGFRPTYMPTASGRPGIAERELAGVSVDLLPDRAGQVLRQALQERLAREHSSVPQTYALGVDYSVAGEGLGIRQDSSVTRLRLIARAAWTLRAQDPAHTVLSQGQARAADDVNVFDQQFFAADLGSEAAQLRLANTISDQIVLQLAGYFRARVPGA